MKLEFSSHDNPEEWISSIARQLNVELKNDSITVPSGMGKGFIKHYYLFPGLTLSHIRIKLHKNLELIRKPVKQSKLIPVMFYSQDFTYEQNIDRGKKLIGRNTPNGIFMPSPQIQSKWFIPAKSSQYHITLSFNKEWLLGSLDHNKDKYLLEILSKDKPFYIFESITPSMLRITHIIDEIITRNESLQNIKLHQKSMELFNSFLQKIEQREVVIDTAKLNAADIEKLFRTRKLLLQTLHNVPTLNELASDAAMSVSKLQKCFRQVFGKSISQFALSEKMNIAKELLDEGKLSVSEVGLELGYSNLSHFTKAFNKQFGINPKSYQTANR